MLYNQLQFYLGLKFLSWSFWGLDLGEGACWKENVLWVSVFVCKIENTTNYDLIPVLFPCSCPAFALSQVKVWAGRWRAISPSPTAAELHPAAPGSSHAPPASLPSPSVRPTPETAAQPHGTLALVWMWHVNVSLCESLTSMISRISHWFSRASSFSWALPTTLSVLKRPLRAHTQIIKSQIKPIYWLFCL